jgi:hypothetical protein
LFLAVAAVPLFAQTALRGKLDKAPDGRPAIRTSDGRLVFVEGDEPTAGVLRDARLFGSEMELLGKGEGDRFAVNPIHTSAIFVHKDGKRLRVTYWCEVCSIRTYTPGKCWCCQEETEIDLREAGDQSS